MPARELLVPNEQLGADLPDESPTPGAELLGHLRRRFNGALFLTPSWLVQLVEK
jgi:hypothetical protein